LSLPFLEEEALSVQVDFVIAEVDFVASGALLLLADTEGRLYCAPLPPPKGAAAFTTVKG
jgi:hypothetical protein